MKPLMLMMLLFLFVRSGISQDFELDTREVLEVIKKWNFASNAMSESTLREIYADQLVFYTQNLSREKSIARKKALFRSNPSFKQKITTDPKFKAYTAGVIKADFVREIFENGRWRPYNSYLLISYERNRYLILAESDIETDRKNNYTLRLGSVMDIPQAPIVKPKVVEPMAVESMTDTTDTSSVDSVVVALEKDTTVAQAPSREDSVISSMTDEVLSDETVAVPKKYVYFLIAFLVLAAAVVLFSRRPKKANRKIPDRGKVNGPSSPQREKAFEMFVKRHFDPHYFTFTAVKGDEPSVQGNINGKQFIPSLELEFQNKECHVRLAIECVFIPHVSSRELLAYSANQINRYHDFEAHYGVEVYVVVGLEGDPGDPKELFLIPTSDLREGYLGYKDLQPFKKHGMFFYNSVRRRLL